MTLHGLLYGLLRQGCAIPDASAVWQLVASIDTAVAAIVASGEHVAHILQALREVLPEPDGELEDEDEA